MKNLLLVKGVNLKTLNKEYFQIILDQKMDKDFLSLKDHKIALNYTLDNKSYNIFRISYIKFISTAQLAEELNNYLIKSDLNIKVDKLVFYYGDFRFPKNKNTEIGKFNSIFKDQLEPRKLRMILYSALKILYTIIDIILMIFL